MAKKLSRSEMMEAAATVYGELLKGLNHTEVMDILGYDAETYEEVRKFMLDVRSDELRTKPREHVYIDYVIEQRRNITDLNDLIKNLDEKTQYNAVVGAIRLRSDIVDKIVQKGQEFGFIKKTAERKELIGGLLLVDMTTDELKKQILGQTKMLEGVVKKFGDADFTTGHDGPLHYGPTFDTTGEDADDEDDEATLRKPEKATGTHRAKTSKRHAGRKRVREER